MSAALSPSERTAELRGAVVWLIGLVALAAVVIVSQVGAARLVGYECEGASGPLYGAEESDFSRCGQIRPR